MANWWDEFPDAGGVAVAEQPAAAPPPAAANWWDSFPDAAQETPEPIQAPRYDDPQQALMLKQGMTAQFGPKGPPVGHPYRAEWDHVDNIGKQAARSQMIADAEIVRNKKAPAGERLAATIRFHESLDAGDYVPHPESNVVKSKNVADNFEDIMYWAKRAPGIGGVIEMSDTMAAKVAADRVASGKYGDEDLAVMARYLINQRKQSEQSFGSTVFDTATQAPAFGVELAMTGGAAPAIRSAINATAKKLLGEVAEKAVAKTATKAVGHAAALTAQTALNPQRVSGSAARRSMADITQQVDADGNVVDVEISDADKSFVAALPAGFLDTAIEIGSEKAGNLINPALAKVGSKLPFAHQVEVAKKAVIDRWLSKPGRSAPQLNKLVQEMGWNGPVAEYLEERVGDAARLSTGLESPDENVVGQTGLAGLAAAQGDMATAKKMIGKAGRQSLVEGAAFAAMGGALAGANVVLNDAEGEAPYKRVQPTTQPGSRRVGRAELQGPSQTADVGTLLRQRELPPNTTVTLDRKPDEKFRNHLIDKGMEPTDASERTWINRQATPTVIDVQASPSQPIVDAPQITATETDELTPPDRSSPIELESKPSIPAADFSSSTDVDTRKQESVPEQPADQIATPSESVPASPQAQQDQLATQENVVGSGPPLTKTKPYRIGPHAPASTKDKLRRQGYQPINAEETLWQREGIDPPKDPKPKKIGKAAVVAATAAEQLFDQQLASTAPRKRLRSPKMYSVESAVTGTLAKMVGSPGAAVAAQPASPEMVERKAQLVAEGKGPFQAGDIGVVPEAVSEDLPADEFVVGERHPEGIVDLNAKDINQFLTSVTDLQEKIPSMSRDQITAQIQHIDTIQEHPDLSVDHGDILSGARKALVAQFRKTKPTPAAPPVTQQEAQQSVPAPQTLPEAEPIPAAPAVAPLAQRGKKIGAKAEPGHSEEGTPKRKVGQKPLGDDDQVKLDVGRGIKKLRHRYSIKNSDGSETPLVIDIVEPQDQMDTDAANFARKFGLEPVFFQGRNGKVRARGMSEGRAVFLRAGQGTSLWEAVGHEVTHGTKLDKIKNFPESVIREHADALMLIVSKEYADNMRNDPTLYRREGIASFVGKMAEDQAFRDRILQENPTLWQKIMDLLSRLFEGFNPESAAARQAIQFLRNVRSQQEAVSEASLDKPAVEEGESDQPILLEDSDVESANPAAEARIKAARGAPRESFLGKKGLQFKQIGKAIVRQNIAIPNDAAHASMNEMLRLLKQHPTIAQETARHNVEAITKGLSPQQFELFSRKVLLDNLLDSVNRNQPVRFGYGVDAQGAFDRNRAIQEIEADIANLDALVAQEPEVQHSLDTRKQFVESMVRGLQKAGLVNDLITKDKQTGVEDLSRVESYFHQQVLDYADAAKAGGRNPQLTKKGFQKARVSGVDQFDQSLDYNTSYLESEFQWMRDAILQMHKQHWLDEVDRKFGILPQLKAQAKQNGTTWQDELRKSDTHRLWNAEAGNQLYGAIGVQEKAVEDVLAGLAQIAEVEEKDLRKVIVMGGKKRPMVLPNELAEQLEHMNALAKNTPGALDAAADISREIQNALKSWYLFGPGLIPYNFRNLLGDLDVVVGGAPGALAYLPTATKAMTAYFSGGTMDADVRKARELGVLDSSFSVQDMPDLEDMPKLGKFFKKRKGVLGKVAAAPAWWFKKVKHVSAARESVSRYAAFLYYRDALRKGSVDHYGASNKGKVDRIKAELGIDAAAAHMARNLLGDYGNLTIMGDVFRQHVMPFHAWTEVTMKRYPQLILNALAYGPRSVGKYNVKAGLRSAAALASVAIPYALMHLWNNMFFPDEEDRLSPTERAMPHLNFGTLPDGTALILRNTSAFGDFLEQLGLLTFAGRMDELRAGQMNTGEVTSEAMHAILNRHINSIRPEAKQILEQVAGHSLYPNPFHGTPKERDILGVLSSDLIAQAAGLPDTWKAAKGAVLQDGTRMRPHAFTRLVIGVTDPRKNSFYEITELRDRYLGELGKAKPAANKYATNMRTAAENGDQAAFEEARRAWLKEKDTHDFDNFQERLDYLDPLARMNQTSGEEEKFVSSYLTADQRQKLRIARDFSQETRISMVEMWNKAEKNDPPALQQKLRAEKEEWLLRKVDQLLEKRPSVLTRNEKKDGLTLERKQTNYDQNRHEALTGIISSGLGKDQIYDLLERSHKEELETFAEGKKYRDRDTRVAAKRDARSNRRKKAKEFRKLLDAEW
jgi:hypothetical protein